MQHYHRHNPATEEDNNQTAGLAYAKTFQAFHEPTNMSNLHFPRFFVFQMFYVLKKRFCTSNPPYVSFLGGPWSQEVDPSPPGSCLRILLRKTFSTPAARRLYNRKFVHTRSRVFRNGRRQQIKKRILPGFEPSDFRKLSLNVGVTS